MDPPELEFFTGWVRDLGLIHSSAKRLLIELRNDFREVEGHLTEMRYFPAKFISKKIIQTFLKVFKGENLGALIQSAANFVNDYGRDMSREAREGFLYLVAAIEIYHRFGNVDANRMEQLIEVLGNLGVEGFEVRSAGENLGVLAVRQFFVGMVDDESFEEQMRILEKMIEVEPENFEWHYRMHRSIQIQRRVPMTTDPPDTKEIDTIFTAYRLAPQNPDVILTFCHCLAELVRHLATLSEEEVESGLIPFGTSKTFSSVKHAVRYLKEEANKILLLDPVCQKFSLGVASIFSSALPHAHRDSRLAKQCLETALIFHPQSSRAIVRRGYFALIIEKEREKAQEYFELAYSKNKQDLSAIHPLVFSYLFQDRVAKERTVLEILAEAMDENLEKDIWTDEQLAHLYYLKGLYLFMGDMEEAADAWISAFKTSKESLSTCFEQLTVLKKRFGCPESYDGLLSLPVFCSQLKGQLQKVSKVNRPILKEVRTLIKIWGRKEDEKARLALKIRYAADMEGIRRRPICEERIIDEQETGRKTAKIQEEAYNLLGLKANTSADGVLRAYEKIIHSFHPVFNGGLSAEEKEDNLLQVKDANWALSVLV